LKDSNVRVHQPWYREIMGKVFNVIVRSIIMSEFKDTQCGFKLFKAPAAKEISPMLTVRGFSFDVEMLYLLLKKGYKVKEVPVIWLNSPESKVNPLLDSLGMFTELLRIKRIHG